MHEKEQWINAIRDNSNETIASIILADIERIEKQEQEIERLNNIINELEKWCLSWKENDKYCYLASNDKDKCRYDIWEEVLDKLQELKRK